MAIDWIQIENNNSIPIVFRFNPWNFINQENLAFQFFIELGSNYEKKNCFQKKC
ncbi:hypothetical protein [Methanobrevibacter curvatus]|uniref:hypothetical protein n=1 Tax=Methanobrevibacter curvatus TaxID=49547 RepID=UPI000A750E4C|nr:hypothetical protein [Methanobrevibacter curvatus]